MSDIISRDNLYHDMTMKYLELHKKGFSFNEFLRGFCFAIEFVNQLPPIEPDQRKKGKWINGRCDQCGEHAPFWAMASTYYLSNFCPNCGADMRDE